MHSSRERTIKVLNTLLQESILTLLGLELVVSVAHLTTLRCCNTCFL